jgi:hypothetical protein
MLQPSWQCDDLPLQCGGTNSKDEGTQNLSTNQEEARALKSAIKYFQ